jgi:hypothetical protein
MLLIVKNSKAQPINISFSQKKKEMKSFAMIP